MMFQLKDFTKCENFNPFTFWLNCKNKLTFNILHINSRTVQKKNLLHFITKLCQKKNKNICIRLEIKSCLLQEKA